MAEAEGEEVGEVTHYFNDIGVGIVSLDGKLEVGDEVSIEGATTDFRQKVESMEIDRQVVEGAGAGDEVGMKVENRVREGDKVYRV